MRGASCIVSVPSRLRPVRVRTGEVQHAHDRRVGHAPRVATAAATAAATGYATTRSVTKLRRRRGGLCICSRYDVLVYSAFSGHFRASNTRARPVAAVRLLTMWMSAISCSAVCRAGVAQQRSSLVADLLTTRARRAEICEEVHACFARAQGRCSHVASTHTARVGSTPLPRIY